MKNKQIKLSSLSEGLRKEVKKHLKEGRTKISQMPWKLKRLIENEMGDMDMENQNRIAQLKAQMQKIKSELRDLGEIDPLDYDEREEPDNFNVSSFSDQAYADRSDYGKEQVRLGRWDPDQEDEHRMGA